MYDSVLKKIRADFAESDWDEVKKALAEYGKEPYHRERERVHFDILMLSKGELEEVRKLVTIALQDYRDVLYWAEYYDNDPWRLWKQLLKELRNGDHLLYDETQKFLNYKGAGFFREPSLVALEELCSLLTEKNVQI